MAAIFTTFRRGGAFGAGGAGVRVRWRGVTAWLHWVVLLLAVFSVCTYRFDLWIDLRDLGRVVGGFVEVVWAVTVLLIPLCAGPRFGGVVGPRWMNRGFSGRLAVALLWPTYFMIGCLLANTVYWFRLVWRGTYDFSIPVTLLIAIVLSAWALLTREWVRTAARLPHVEAVSRWVQWRAALVALPSAAFGWWVFLVLTYAHPPTGPVDVAVVLGNRVLGDGTASVVLEERTLAAIRLFRKGLARHLLLSGTISPALKAGLPMRNEALAMRGVCLANGLVETDFSLDPWGVNTRATAANTKAFMESRGYTSVVACSSNYHLLRTARSFREVGITAYTVAAEPTVWICADPRETIRDMIGVVVYTLDRNYRASKGTVMELAHPRVVVRKSTNTLELFDGATLVKTYPCITGGNAGDKETEGDRRTPVGNFHIVYKNPQSKFHLSMGLDYPNREDAARGLASKLISREQYEGILAALDSDLSLEENQKKLWYTPLGGEIFLHGHAEGRTGTAGCIALANADIDELYGILRVGTGVEIRP